MKGKGKRSFRSPGRRRRQFVRGRGLRAFVAIGRKKQDSIIEEDEKRNIIIVIDFVTQLKEKVSSQIGPSNQIKCIKKCTLIKVFLIRVLFFNQEAYSTDKEFADSNEFDNLNAKKSRRIYQIPPL